MIFVTVGTHEQQFDRLVKYMDKLKREGIIQEEVIIQTGYSAYEPKYCKWSDFFAYQDMQKMINDARIVITHGGPSSFIAPLQLGKIPIVVPRRREFGEHVNNHQVNFIKKVSSRQKNVIPIYNIRDLKEVITNYDKIVYGMNHEVTSHNEEFNRKLEEIVAQVLKL